ncbi:MAG TPA: TonB-dependent receptor [Caulobacteraceae bacterium]|jgi:iron complex outermembrane receptor protein|nr:TonB-dependent receptor [Caulobacteraceae bacterium]
MKSKWVYHLLTTAVLVAPGAAYAQAAPKISETATAATQANATAGSDVVVTAQRRSQRVMKVPIAVTALAGATIQAAGVVNSRELEQLTPGLKTGQAGYVFQPAIRGISSTDTSPGDESDVGIYVDGVYLADEGGSAFNLANIDRIEVLKGPQGTLYGRNATAGAIRIITSEPKDTPHLTLDGSAGFDGPESRQLSAYVTGPIVKGVLDGGLSAYIYGDNGYMTNVNPAFSGSRQGSTNTWNLRGKLRFTPTDNLTITFEGDDGWTRSGVELTTVFVNNVDGFKNVVGVLDPTQPFQVATNEQNYDYTSAYGAYMNVEYRFPNFTLTSLSAYRYVDNTVSLDNDRTNLTLNRNTYSVYDKTFQEELNFSSSWAGPFSIVGGLFYFYDSGGTYWSQAYAAPISAVGGCGGTPVVCAPPGMRVQTGPLAPITHQQGNETRNAYSAFGEGTYHFNDQWSLIAGARYNVDDATAWSNNLPPYVSTGRQTGSKSWSNFSYRLTLNWQPTPNLLLYFTNSTGFKSGYIYAAGYVGPVRNAQGQIISTTPISSVVPETITDFEGGAKLHAFDMVDFTLSAFHYDYRNIQILTNNALAANVGVVGNSTLQNAAAANITGMEFTADARFNENWSGSLGLSWLPSANFTNFPDGIHYVANPGGLGATSIASNLSGTRMSRAPLYTVDVALAYQHPLFEGRFRLSADYYYSALEYLVVGEDTPNPAYGVLNSEMGWTDPTNRYTVSIFGRNLTNQAYFISGLANTGGFSAVWGKPREVGIRLKVSY